MARTPSAYILFIMLILFALFAFAGVPVLAGIEPLPVGKASDAGAIGPGRVTLRLEPTGRWSALQVAWEGQESLIKGGGVAVYTVRDDGTVIELANTAGDNLETAGGAAFFEACEGIAGGFRAPSARPDDDGDGRHDEDRLDGIDNDNDGRTDEDYAAIGDEMVVCTVRSVADVPHPIALHQEFYAWSLPHIDGAIMMSVRVRNLGDARLDNLRVAIYYTRDGELTVRRQRLGTGANISHINARTRLALVPFSGSGQGWSDGVIAETENVSAAMKQSVRRTEDAVAEMPADLQTAIDGGAVYSMSPVLGPLAPGEEVRVDIGLIAFPENVSVDEATGPAIKTFAGYGGNAYLPPPVAVKPRVLWGYYRPLPNQAGVWLDFEELGQQAFTADDFSFITGAAGNVVERYEIEPGHWVLTLPAGTVDEWTREDDRITLKGRLRSGEFFEAIVRPRYDKEIPPVAAEEAERFWSTAGRLTQQLLKASPNPFREVTKIAWEIPAVLEQEDGSVLHFTGPYETAVRIYNVQGRLVNTLDERIAGPGTYSLDWAGVDQSGNAVASGVYYVKLQIEKRFITKRLIYVK